MVVQLFVTLALISSIVGLGVIVALFLRYPLEIILRFEWHFCGFALVCNGLTGEEQQVSRKQCDQIWRNFAILAKG